MSQIARNMMDTEEYDSKIISGFSRYEVNKRGDVFDRKLGRYVNRIENQAGGYSVSIVSDGGVQKLVYVQKLVADTFLPNPENRKFIGFHDGDKKNVSLKNLFWRTEFMNKALRKPRGKARHQERNDNHIYTPKHQTIVETKTENSTAIPVAIPNNDIIFFTTEGGVQKEMLKLASNGDIFVKGALVKNNLKVVKAFEEWCAKNIPM